MVKLDLTNFHHNQQTDLKIVCNILKVTAQQDTSTPGIKYLTYLLLQGLTKYKLTVCYNGNPGDKYLHPLLKLDGDEVVLWRNYDNLLQVDTTGTKHHFTFMLPEDGYYELFLLWFGNQEICDTVCIKSICLELCDPKEEQTICTISDAMCVNGKVGEKLFIRTNTNEDIPENVCPIFSIVVPEVLTDNPPNIDEYTGLVSWVPSAAGVCSFDVKAEWENFDNKFKLTIPVNVDVEGVETVCLSGGGLDRTGKLGQKLFINATDQADVSLDTCPTFSLNVPKSLQGEDLCIDECTGLISWTPNIGGTCTFYVKAEWVEDCTKNILKFPVNVAITEPTKICTNGQGLTGTGKVGKKLFIEANQQGDVMMDKCPEFELKIPKALEGEDLCVDECTGLISWSPTVGGTCTFYVKVEWVDGCDNYKLTFPVVVTIAELETICLSGEGLDRTGKLGQKLFINATDQADVSLDDCPEFELGDLKALEGEDLCIDKYTGLITWTPTVGGTCTFYVKAKWEEDCVLNKLSFPVNVFVSKPNIICSKQAKMQVSGKVNEKLFIDAGITGDICDVTYELCVPSILENNKPTINAQTGLVSWIPTTGGTCNFEVKVEWKNDCDINKQTIPICVVVSEPKTICSKQTKPTINAKKDEKLFIDAGITASICGTTYTLCVPTALENNKPTIDSETGLISWTPSVGGTCKFDVKVEWEADCTNYKEIISFCVVVSEPKTICSKQTKPTINAKKGEKLFIDAGITADICGATYTLCDSEALGDNKPIIDSETGLISWTPSVGGTCKFDVKVEWKDDCTIYKEILAYCVVVSEPLTICSKQTKDPIDGKKGEKLFIDAGITASICGTTYTLCIPAALETEDLDIDSQTGLISWTPSEGGTCKFDVKVEWKDDCTYYKETIAYCVVVSEPNIQCKEEETVTSVTGKVGKKLFIHTTVHFTPLDDVCYKYSLDAPDVYSAGPTIDECTGLISWIPDIGGTCSFDVKVTWDMDNDEFDEHKLIIPFDVFVEEKAFSCEIADPIPGNGMTGSFISIFTHSVFGDGATAIPNDVQPTFSIDGECYGVDNKPCVDPNTGLFTWVGADVQGIYNFTVTARWTKDCDEYKLIIPIVIDLDTQA